jgi:hypothetical protein
MPLPQRPMFPRSAGVVPPRARQVGPVFSVGRRMLIAAEAKRRVILTDDKGAELRAAIRQGAEVEILAWQPRGVGGIRYRVRSMKDGVEGWLGAASLRAHPLPPVAAITRIAATVRPVAAAGRKRR